MNTPKNSEDTRQSGQGAAGSAIIGSTRFADSTMPKHLRRVGNKLSSGAGVGRNWLEWLNEGDNASQLRRVYETQGMRGVKETTGLNKTQAYELVGHMGLRREKIAKDNLDRAQRYSRALYKRRRRHLKDHYGWIPGMNCCFLKSFEQFYRGTVHVGRKSVDGYVCVTKFPFPAVRAYLKKHGLRYYVTKYEVIPVENVPDTQVTWLVLRKHGLEPLAQNERDPVWADEDVRKFISAPEIEREEVAFTSG